MKISEEAVVAGAKAMDAYWGGRYAPDEVEELRGEITAVLEAAAPHMLAPILALCDEADTRRGSSMYCKLTTYEIRETLGVEK